MGAAIKSNGHVAAHRIAVPRLKPSERAQLVAANVQPFRGHGRRTI